VDDWGRRIVGVLQIANGATGLIMSLPVLVARSTVRGPLYVEFLFCLVSGLFIVAGVLLLEKQPRGLSLSKYLQLFAAPILFSPVFSYQLLSGLTVRAALGAVSGFQLFWANGLIVRLFPEDEVSVGLNILAIGLFFYLRSCSFDKGPSLEKRRLQAFD
jgi:hypothetical protein